MSSYILTATVDSVVPSPKEVIGCAPIKINALEQMSTPELAVVLVVAMIG
jgi:hypothetical protein